MKQTTFIRTSLSTIIDETNAVPFSLSSKIDVIRAAKIVLEKINPHRFIHLNIFKVDPVAELRKFEKEIKKSTTNYEFHERMREIFQSMNDLHTRYFRPAPLNMTFAFIGFDMKEFFEKGSREPKYVVDDITPSLLPTDAKLDEGSEILSIDGMDVQKVIRKLGKDSSASNNAAKDAIGISRLTSRPLVVDSAPSKPTMTVKFRNSLGKKFTEVYPWIYLKITEESMMSAIFSSLLVGNPVFPKEIDEETDKHIRRSAKLAHTNIASVRLRSKNRTVVPVNELYTNVFSAEIINTSRGRIGKLNIMRFFPRRIDVVEEFKRLLRLMPKKGLIVDIRGNPGGFYANAKAFSEALSGKEIPKLGLQPQASDEVVSALKSWKVGFGSDVRLFSISLLPAALKANLAREFFSGTALDRSFQLPGTQERVYFGPYVTIIDGQTYSAGDVFTLLQKDFDASVIVGTSSNTGAGGANTLSYREYIEPLSSVYPSLPQGVDFSTSFARFFRVGKNSGAIVEFFGVKPNKRYYLSKKDILKEECDFIEYLAKKLDKM